MTTRPVQMEVTNFKHKEHKECSSDAPPPATLPRKCCLAWSPVGNQLNFFSLPVPHHGSRGLGKQKSAEVYLTLMTLAIPKFQSFERILPGFASKHWVFFQNSAAGSPAAFTTCLCRIPPSSSYPSASAARRGTYNPAHPAPFIRAIWWGTKSF